MSHTNFLSILLFWLLLANISSIHMLIQLLFWFFQSTIFCLTPFDLSEHVSIFYVCLAFWCWVQVFKIVGHVCNLAIQRSSQKCLCRWWLFWLNTNLLILCWSSKSLAGLLLRESQCTDPQISSDWCFDPIPARSNEKFGIQSSCFNKDDNVDTVVHLFWQFLW